MSGDEAVTDFSIYRKEKKRHELVEWADEKLKIGRFC
jgi:hypothetical protein